ncbi:restriction endonuclease subunit S [Legionella pneumophila]|uniref:restriction endonuclease subunit S n=1 Tax=Legionella pneumophila TaxID=446 RepID=UPI0038B5AB84
MSNKNKEKNTALKQCVQPKLRFPEFQDLEGWINDNLGSLYTFITTNCYSRDKLNYKNGIVRNIHYGDIHKKFNALFDIKKEIVPFVNETENIEKLKSDSYCIKGDIIFADASENMDDVGKSIEIVNLHNEKLLAGLHTILARPKGQKFIVGFGGYLFQSKMIRTQIKKQAQGTKVFGISASRLATIEIFYPLEKEQQKIADCLSSIDELITAESKKLDALKIYKKGLMQQLFPAEGETLPKLRFPEFKSAGNWEIKLLGNLIKYKNGIAHEQNISDIGKYIVVNSKFISTEGEVRKFTNDGLCIVQKGNILMVLSDVPNGKAIAKCFLVDRDDFYTVNQRICIINPEKNISEFIYYTIDRNPFYLNFDDRVKQTNLRKDEVLSCPIAVPPSKKEQQKIAEVIASVDDFIMNQIKKVNTLKNHKKGLMQQLFPAISEL